MTDQAAQQAVVEELAKRGVKCHKVPWTGRSNSGRSKAHRYGRVKTLLTQGRLFLLDNSELRSELTEITVSPSASDPGYSIQTHGPDDMADAAVMAITEAQRPKKELVSGKVVASTLAESLGKSYPCPVGSFFRDSGWLEVKSQLIAPSRGMV